MMSVDDIIPYANNPRNNKDAVDKVAASIREFGFKQAIIVDKDMVIIAGHTRLKAAKKLKMKEVPVLVADDLSEEQVKAYRLADNKTAEFAEWDEDLLNIELDGILDLDMEQFGFELDFGDNEDSTTEVEEDDFTEDVESRCKLGDIWQLGRHRLICGDSTDVAVIDRLMDGVKADMVFTDPPYGMNLDTDWSGAKSNLNFYKEKGCKGQGNKYDKVIGDNDDFKEDLIKTIFNNFGYCKEIFVWGADYYPELLQGYKDGNMFVWDKRSNEDTKDEYVEKSDKMYGSQFELCWSKNKHRKQIARVKWAGIFGTEKEFDKKRVHPTQKPSALAGWFLERYSKEGQTVVDLFGGSGSTLIACEQLNRKCYMCEISPQYIDVIIQRYINLKGSDEDVYLIRDGKKINYKDVI